MERYSIPKVIAYLFIVLSIMYILLFLLDTTYAEIPEYSDLRDLWRPALGHIKNAVKRRRRTTGGAVHEVISISVRLDDMHNQRTITRLYRVPPMKSPQFCMPRWNMDLLF